MELEIINQNKNKKQNTKNQWMIHNNKNSEIKAKFTLFNLQFVL